MNYEEKYKKLLSLLITLAKPEFSQDELDNADDYVRDHDTSKDVNLHDALDIQDKLTGAHIRTYLKEHIDLDLNDLSVDTALELLEINKDVIDLLKNVDPELIRNQDLKGIKKALLEKKNVLNLMKG
jgi:hypothetical protein